MATAAERDLAGALRAPVRAAAGEPVEAFAEPATDARVLALVARFAAAVFAAAGFGAAAFGPAVDFAAAADFGAAVVSDGSEARAADARVAAAVFDAEAACAAAVDLVAAVRGAAVFGAGLRAGERVDVDRVLPVRELAVREAPPPSFVEAAPLSRDASSDGDAGVSEGSEPGGD